MRLLLSLPVLVVGEVAGITALALADVDYFAHRIAAKIAGTDENP